jgi:hypothetical protein
MTHHEGTPEPARNPKDLLGGPDRLPGGTRRPPPGRRTGHSRTTMR